MSKKIQNQFKILMASYDAVENEEMYQYTLKTKLGLLYVSFCTEGTIWSINSRFQNLNLVDFFKIFENYDGLNTFSYKWNLLSYKDKVQFILIEFEDRLKKIIENPFYKLYDTQTGCDMATGYNVRSLLELTECYKSYKSHDMTKKNYNILNKMSVSEIINFIETDGFVIDKSETKFE